MILNMSGGGGGAALNFKVVGGTSAPSNPAENTIWVNTDTEITGWVFSATVPENPEEGMVHFATSSAAVAEFNAVKKNSVQVYPNGCTQYIGGAWVSKDAETYQNGQWLSWTLYLYMNGTFYDVAGSMTQVPVKWKSGLSGNVPGIDGTCNISTDSTPMTIKSIGNMSAIAYFSKKIDLTPYKTLVFNGSITSNSPTQGRQFGIWSSFGTLYTDGRVAYLDGDMSDGDHIIDVSELSGEHYIGWWISGATNYATITVNQVYLK